jgi:hypothetical protein
VLARLPAPRGVMPARSSGLLDGSFNTLRLGNSSIHVWYRAVRESIVVSTQRIPAPRPDGVANTGLRSKVVVERVEVLKHQPGRRASTTVVPVLNDDRRLLQSRAKCRERFRGQDA